MSVRDFQYHRISNRHLAIFSLLLICDLHTSSLTASAVAVVAVAVLFLTLRIGMGDLKLASLLILTEGSIVLSAQYLQVAFVTLLLTITVRWARERNLKGSVAFAHVILAPFLLLYLAI